MNGEAKAQVERGIFERFASDVGLRVRANSLTQPDKRVCRTMLAQLAARLANLQDGMEGAVFPELPIGLVSATLKRFDIDDGPRINELSASGASGFDLRRIDEKITRYSEGWGGLARSGMPRKSMR